MCSPNMVTYSRLQDTPGRHGLAAEDLPGQKYQQYERTNLNGKTKVTRYECSRL